MRKKIGLFVLLAAMGLAVALPTPLAAQNGPNLDKLQILTWNVFLRPRHLFWNDDQLGRAVDIVEALRDQYFDVLVLQEVFDKRSTDLIIDGLKDLYPYFVRPVRRNPLNLTSGVLILSRHAIDKIDRFVYRQCAGSDCFADKGAVLVEFSKGGRTFQVIGTHAQAESGRKYEQIRALQYADIREKLIEQHRRPGVPQIIVGDMNTECVDESMAYSEMLNTLDVVDGDVLLPDGDLVPGIEPYTWGCSRNDWIPDAYKGKTQLLDYALFRANGALPRFVKRSLQVFKRPIKKAGRKRHLSDHYALSMVIDL